jgi:hypothetical protein
MRPIFGNVGTVLMAENLKVCVLLPSLLTILRSTDSFTWGVVLDGTVQLTNEKCKCSNGKKFAFYGHSGYLSKAKDCFQRLFALLLTLHDPNF